MSKNLSKNNNSVSVTAFKSVLSQKSIREQFETALAGKSGPFMASLLELFVSDKNLQQCDPNLVVIEALKAAALDLPVVKPLGQAYIVPYKKIPTFILGYKGLIQLALRSGQYRTLNADVVWSGESIEIDRLSGRVLFKGGEKSDKPIGYFAHQELSNGFEKTVYMTVKEVKNHAKKYSPSSRKNFGPWSDEFDKMALKTVLLKLLRTYGFLSTAMAQVVSYDADIPDIQNTEDVIEIVEESDGQDFESEAPVQEAEVPPFMMGG